MELQSLQITVLLTCLGLMIAQILVKDKRATHILFAIFCGSVAMSLAKGLSGNVIGTYQYLIGMAACITCNGYWLLSRALFRKENAIKLPHLLFAGAIALLIMLNQGFLFASNSGFIQTNDTSMFKHVLRELTVLLSSSILVLSFWEGLRGFKHANNTEKAQRFLFLATFGGAVASSKVLQGLFIDTPMAKDFALASITFVVVASTQLQILWQDKTRNHDSEAATSASTKALLHQQQIKPPLENTASLDESVLAEQIKTLLLNDALYLKANLKIADIAQKLGVPEYRVSNALRHNLKARNFNQHVNALRIQHAKKLLADEDKQKWTVLVVGLESGFASVGPFTRAFKAATGFTPNQYRQRLSQTESA
ncbi:helix-turn-helix domain-containing protein [Alteromonas gracilis]|uniref:helix-turn-helix domain-containing protein n=1 Tax=Alteromonas gracilis TaxID=1479524 RepID=UPI0037357C7C